MARPLGFDPADARQALKQAFWAKGFEGTSMQDIEAATGLNKQSLYRLFGDKRGMYLEALREYEDCEVAGAEALLGQPGSGRERVARLLDAVIVAAVNGVNPNGCFLAAATADADPADAETAALLREMSDRIYRALVAALESDRAPEAATAQARVLQATYMGLRLMLKGGLDEAEARLIARGALAAI